MPTKLQHAWYQSNLCNMLIVASQFGRQQLWGGVNYAISTLLLILFPLHALIPALGVAADSAAGMIVHLILYKFVVFRRCA